MSSMQEVTPGITVTDECGTENDSIIAHEVEGVAYTLANSADGTLVTAIPAEGYLLVPGERWSYDPHAGTVSTIVHLTDVPCFDGEDGYTEGPWTPPLTELPATGGDGITMAAFGIAIVAAGLAAMAWDWLGQTMRQGG